MGYKLGKMGIKKFLTIICMLSVVSVYAHEIENSIKKLNKININSKNLAQIVTLEGTPNSFKFKSSVIDKPKQKHLKKIKQISSEDKYIVKIYSNDDKVKYAIGIGNPFYATYQHIGYENSKYMGGLVTQANIDIVIPLNIEAAYLIISKRSPLGKLEDFQKISLK